MQHAIELEAKQMSLAFIDIEPGSKEEEEEEDINRMRPRRGEGDKQEY